MKEHAKKHTAVWMKCNYCNKKFDTTTKDSTNVVHTERAGKPFVVKNVLDL